MYQRKILISRMSKADCSICHADLDAASSLNQNESHIHKECEIYINLSGDVSFEVENRIYPVSRGSVIITRPFEYHHCIYHSNQRHEHFWITFSAEENDHFLKMFFGREKGKDNLILLDETQLQELCSILNALLKESEDPLQQRIWFLQMFQVLSAGKVEDHTSYVEDLPPDVVLALHYMDAHLCEDFNSKCLASACNVSVNTLERHFKDIFQITPFGMLRKKRLFASMECLRNGSSVTEAAIESGFSDYSNYIQVFKKQFGITPLSYKKKYIAKERTA